MWISSFSIKNYKSFFETPEIALTSGFNVIVGKNNVGKTALIEALTLPHGSKQHRSQRTIPFVGAPQQSKSETTLTFVLSKDEFEQAVFGSDRREFYVAGTYFHEKRDEYSRLIQHMLAGSTINLTFSFEHTNLVYGAFFPSIGEPQTVPIPAAHFSIDHAQHRFELDGLANLNDLNALIGSQIAPNLINRIYTFQAERFNISEAVISNRRDLETNASNLPQVLNFLQTDNPARFGKYVNHVKQIFPDITAITIPPVGQDNKVRVSLWAIEPDTERADLAIPLAESGTGISQILAMLYVVVTSDQPTVILIDEPQSFLHPGAVRKLFDILKMYPYHQYIVTTHSPTAITSADIRTLLFVRKEGTESSIERVDIKETERLRLILSEVGARFSDVFGADDILWVEGPTEERCFPKILSIIAKYPLFG